MKTYTTKRIAITVLSLVILATGCGTKKWTVVSYPPEKRAKNEEILPQHAVPEAKYDRTREKTEQKKVVVKDKPPARHELLVPKKDTSKRKIREKLIAKKEHGRIQEKVIDRSALAVESCKKALFDGKALIKQGKYEEAIACLEAVDWQYAPAPVKAEGLYVMGMLHVKLGNVQKSAKYLNDAVALGGLPTSLANRAYFSIGLLSLSKDPKKAMAAFRKSSRDKSAGLTPEQAGFAEGYVKAYGGK